MEVNEKEGGAMATHMIDINLDKKCVRCGEAGATQGGYCLKCVIKNMYEGKYDHIFKKGESKMAKIGDKAVSFIQDAIAGFLTSKKSMINEAYLKARGDKLAISIGVTMAPGKGVNDVNIKVTISFVKDKEKDEIEVSIDESQLSLYDQGVKTPSEKAMESLGD
jgi:hypothetical protein